MSWVPGWNSVTGAHSWSNVYFWASIASLILLGITEVISHRYTERHDELAAAEQDSTQRRHDEEVARLHRETAQLSADAEAARAQIAEAQARTAEAQLALEKYKGPRNISREEVDHLVAALKPLGPAPYDLAVPAAGLEPGSLLLDQLIAALRRAGWDLRSVHGSVLKGKLSPALALLSIDIPTGSKNAVPPDIEVARNVGLVGIRVVFDSRASPQLAASARALASALNDMDLTAEALDTPTEGDAATNTIHVNVGSKR